jgi:hypothetical protein
VSIFIQSYANSNFRSYISIMLKGKTSPKNCSWRLSNRKLKNAVVIPCHDRLWFLLVDNKSQPVSIYNISIFKYIYCRNLQLLNNWIIIKTKALLPHASVTITVFLAIYLGTFKLFDFHIFWHEAYLVKVIQKRVVFLRIGENCGIANRKLKKAVVIPCHDRLWFLLVDNKSQPVSIYNISILE